LASNIKTKARGLSAAVLICLSLFGCGHLWGNCRRRNRRCSFAKGERKSENNCEKRICETKTIYHALLAVTTNYAMRLQGQIVIFSRRKVDKETNDLFQVGFEN
jgi:hypothetical protein